MQTTRIITNDEELQSLKALLSARNKPFSITIKAGKHRTGGQNRLQHMWYQEAAEQLGEYDAGENKNRCKLRFGVPILRGTSERFNAMWEARAEHLPYEEQVQLVEFINVTSIMTSKEKKQYLYAVQKFFLERGVKLTDPEARI